MTNKRFKLKNIEYPIIYNLYSATFQLAYNITLTLALVDMDFNGINKITF